MICGYKRLSLSLDEKITIKGLISHRLGLLATGNCRDSFTYPQLSELTNMQLLDLWCIHFFRTLSDFHIVDTSKWGHR